MNEAEDVVKQKISIMMPLMSHKFAVKFDNQQLMSAITSQVASVSINLLDKEAELIVYHPLAGNDLIKALNSLLKNNLFPIYVTDNNERQLFMLYNCQIVFHNMSLDYQTDEPVIHNIVVSFESIEDSSSFTQEIV